MIFQTKKNRFTPLKVRICPWWKKGYKAKPPIGFDFINSKTSEKPLTGFTVVEMLVVVAMMLILIGTIFTNYRQGQNKMALERSAYKILASARKIQTMAGLENNACIGVAGYKYGYGILFSSLSGDVKKYTLFADCDGNRSFSASDIAIEIVNFETNVSISQLFIESTSKNRVDTVFTPPNPNVTFVDPSTGSGKWGVIRIQIPGSIYKDIKINEVGLVDII